MDANQLYKKMTNHEWDFEKLPEWKLSGIVIEMFNMISKPGVNIEEEDLEDINLLGKYIAESEYQHMDNSIIDWIYFNRGNPSRIMLGFGFLEGYWGYALVSSNKVLQKTLQIIKALDPKNKAYAQALMALSNTTLTWQNFPLNLQLDLAELLADGTKSLSKINPNDEHLYFLVETLKNLPEFKKE